MAATVRPQKLREALNAKLGSASLKLHEIREAEQPRLDRFYEPRDSVVNFLHAARGVFPIIKTFGEDNLRPAGFKKWVDAWESGRLSAPERDLWERIRDERISQEHGEGAGLIPHKIPITQGDQLQVFQNSVLLGVPPPPPPCKIGVRFDAYPNQPASEVCTEYLELSKRFVGDFLRDHAYLIP